MGSSREPAMNLAEPIAVTLRVADALEKLGVRYLVGGSLASSVHGIPRSTQDVDLLVELPGARVDALAAELEPSFYVDRDMMADAVRRRASFNVIELSTMFKVDLFVSDRSPLLVEEMDRRQAVDIGDPPRRIHVCTAEDIIVQKLDWYEKGGRVSERQWNDLVGVLRVRGPALDTEYLRRWSGALGFEPLLDEALAAAGRT
jgi:hypothetical protein